jgi:hypothetical protein
VLATQPFGGSGTDAEVIADAINPFALYSQMSDVSPAPLGAELEAQLLTADDMPAGYSSVSQVSFQVPCPSGHIQLASNEFTPNGRSPDVLGPTVMTFVMDMPHDQADEVRALPAQDNLGDIPDSADEYGIRMTRLGKLDSSGLGEFADGERLEIDLSGVPGDVRAQLAQAGTELTIDRIIVDQYIFMRGDRMYATTVIYASGSPPPADARQLALLLYSRKPSSRLVPQQHLPHEQLASDRPEAPAVSARVRVRAEHVPQSVARWRVEALEQQSTLIARVA